MRSKHNKSALTKDDMAWLEQRLSITMLPVQPRPEFVMRARQAVLAGSIADDESRVSPWLAPLSAMLLGCALVVLAIALARRRANL